MVEQVVNDQTDELEGADSPFLQRSNVERETDATLQDFADSENAALLAYIGPYLGVRVSPIHYQTASITIFDEFAIESIIEELKQNKINKAYFLINSFGDQMDATYKIAKVLRTALDEIVTFVPHIAASGGTLFAITGDQIVMGPMSNITPIDPQVRHNGSQVSAVSGKRAFDCATRFYQKVTVHEAPYAHRSFTDRLDPFLIEEWDGIVQTARSYAQEILKSSNYDKDKAVEIADCLIKKFPSHDYCIGPELATKIGLRVDKPENNSKRWKHMRNWLGNYLFKSQARSCIHYVIPKSSHVSARKIRTRGGTKRAYPVNAHTDNM